jgi:uncharacterized protein (TIGR02271 family)
MITQDQLRNVIGTTAYDRDGDKIGKVGQVYYDDDTDQPRWITVNTGFFGTNENFVPVQGAEMGSDRVTVAYDKATVKDAPNIAEDGHLTPEEEAALYRHYGLDYGTGAVGTVGDGRTDYDRTDRTDRSADTVGYDTSGPTTDTAMTRSEEHLRVGTEVREAGRARLRKYIVTDRETAQVPVSREEVRVQREPITDANRGDAYDGPALSEEEHEVVLHEERPVVDTEVEAVERVRLDTETVRGTETVSGEVRKEEIEVIDETTTVRDRDRDLDRDR